MLPAKYKRSKNESAKYETDAAAGLSLPRTGHLSQQRISHGVQASSGPLF